MDDLDRKIISQLRCDFPLVPRPFESLGRPLRLSADEILIRLHHIKHDRGWAGLSWFFDRKKMGFKQTLAAMNISGSDAAENALLWLSSHPGISSVYRQDHDLNLWFSISVPAEHFLS